MRPRIPLIIIILILGCVCFYNLGSAPLIDQVDEGLYANAARQMIDSGDWVTPRVGPDLFLQAPLKLLVPGFLHSGFGSHTFGCSIAVGNCGLSYGASSLLLGREKRRHPRWVVGHHIVCAVSFGGNGISSHSEDG